MIYQFSDFEVNTLNKQLYIHGKLTVADERLINLLIELINHYPNHCTKKSLLATLWPDTVVSDWSISKLVSDVRQLFKQHGFNDKVIQTLHGRGYRLASTLGEHISAIDHKQTKPVTTDPNQAVFSYAKKAKWWVLLVFILMAGLSDYFFNFIPTQLQKSEPPNSIGRLLWVDDNPDNNSAEKAYFENHNITVYQVTSTDAAMTSLQLYEYKVIISDMGRDGEVLAGLNLLKAMRNENDHTPFVMYTIVLTQAQQDLLDQYQGQGVAVEADKLYQLVLPFFAPPQNKFQIKLQPPDLAHFHNLSKAFKNKPSKLTYTFKGH